MYSETAATIATKPSADRSANLPDTQSEADSRGVVISSAGIAKLRLPFLLIDVDGSTSATVLSARAGVAVPATSRGTHMSRFVEFLHERSARPLLLQQLPVWLEQLRERLDAPAANLQLSGSVFVPKCAPVSGRESLLEIPVSYALRSDQEPGLRQTASVLATTVCPCSRAIADRGAHNQRCTVNFDLEVLDWVAIQDLVKAVDNSASCAIYGILKRADEKAVTEIGYDNAKFVEDVVRDAYLAISNDRRITRSTVEASSHESIHGHDATAMIEAEV